MRVQKRSKKDEDKGSPLATFEALGFVADGTSGEEEYGDCLLCGSSGKFYLNRESGLWSCKKCDESGNLTSFLGKYVKHCRKVHRILGKKLQTLAEHRSIPAVALLEAGVFWDGERYCFPIQNSKGSVVNLRRFKLEGKIRLMGLPGVPTGLWGVEDLKEHTKKVFICEGEWDRIACRQFLIEQGYERQLGTGVYVVISVPGASTWKQDWNRFVEGKEVILVFDNDGPGQRGLVKTYGLLGGGTRASRRKVKWVQWPEGLPTGFDMRDFYKADGTWDVFEEMLSEDNPDKVAEMGDEETHVERNRSDRPSLDEVLKIYRKWLKMTPEHERILKIVYALILSNQLKGDPLWMHIVGPPGSGKTEILMSCSGCEEVVCASSVTPHSLVSGFQNHGGADPSLIPQVIDRVFILKDFTEILQMPKAQRDEVYAILRGAYDGEVTKRFGNGVIREYHGYFSMIAGVTHSIDGDADNAMGERFLKYRMKSSSEKTRRQVILESLQNVGNEHEMKAELQEIAARFLSFDIPDRMPDVPMPTLERIVALAELVSVLRTTVERDMVQRDRIKFRPQPEVGTRIAKQLKRLLLGLALLHDPVALTEADYDIVAQVAMDSCIPFHLDVIGYLIRHPGSTIEEVSKAIVIPMTTIRECFDSMVLLGVLKKVQDESDRGPGRRPFKWFVTSEVENKWKQAQI